MIRALLFAASLLAAANPACAWVAQRAAVPGYTAPGDIVPYTAWYGLRAYNGVVAALGTRPMLRIRNPTSGELCDVLIATSGDKGVTSNCSSTGAGQTVSAFCGATDCRVNKIYDQTQGNACGGSTCDLVQATAGNQPYLLAADSYNAVTSQISTTVLMNSATNYTANVAAKMTITGVGNVSNAQFANILAQGANLINHGGVAAQWNISGSGGGRNYNGISDGAWHTAVANLNAGGSLTGLCLATNCSIEFGNNSPGTSTTAGLMQILGLASATTVNKFREGGIIDNHSASYSEANLLNSNASAYWGFTPP